MTKKRIACFFTGGYTEVNALKTFLKKVNNSVEYIQLCPVGIRKNMTSVKTRAITEIRTNQNGLTGASLISHISQHIREEKYHFAEERYDAILIEDDKDDRFLDKTEDGFSEINQLKWKEHKQEVTDSIHAVYPEIPVIFIYAAPEVETWFLADWDNSFGKVYKLDKTLTAETNGVFSVRFHRHIREKILTAQYGDNLEAYGYFGGVYRKLSEEIQQALDSEVFINDCSSNKHLRYSKKVQGEMMLEAIEPENVVRSCATFFRSGYYALASL